ncbi:multidrug DMT transporter permease [Saccharospirillum sp. MSK14-1]|uniref:DMT family transporter n=1 Tax=Saccharospirillum sp. MSK14-1 TaxID=1897632 RepID=UPI000D39A602|nr:DMT family transporter [Saccharospirillum sp. MSK14-1]PTY36380.1 multidrug DMT transporter permease [Saccharospirillum sp. MSK14-1]
MNALLFIASVLIWGTTWLAIAMQTGPVPVVVSVFYRFALAAVVLLVFLLVTRRLRKIAMTDHLFCLLQGACVFCVNFLCFYTASRWISSGLESVLFSMATLFNALNGVLFFGHRITPRLALANTCGLVGMLALFWQDLMSASLSSGVLLGAGLTLVGTYGFSLGNMISARHQRRGLDVLSTNAYAMGYGALLLLVAMTLTGAGLAWDVRPEYGLALAYLAVFGSVIGFATYFLLIGRIGSGSAAYVTVTAPLVAMLLSTWLESYQWSLSAVLGIALILLGNVVMFYKPRPRAASAKTPTELASTV